MNARERKLLAATVLVLCLGLLVFLDGDEEAAATSASADTPADAGAAVASAEAAAAQPVAATFSLAELSALLDQLPPNAELAGTGDPFRPLKTPGARRAPPRGVTQPTPRPPLPLCGGVFLSGSVHGALLDGRVVFVGETFGDFALVGVSTQGVRVLYQGEEIMLLFDPSNPQATPSEGDQGPHEKGDHGAAH